MRKMQHSRLTRWIIALIMLGSACILLSQTSQLENFAALLWFFSLGLMVTALVLEVVRTRRSASSTSRKSR